MSSSIASRTRSRTDKAEFRRALEALASTPAPLTEEESRALSWAGATERFLDAVGEASRLATAPTLADEAAHCLPLAHRLEGYVGDALKSSSSRA